MRRFAICCILLVVGMVCVTPAVAKEMRKLSTAQLQALATEENNAEAQFYLAFRYLHGTNFTQDTINALELLQTAADSGNSNAAVFAGFMYAAGIGTIQDCYTANQYLELGKQQKEAYDSMQGYLYMYGLCREQNYVDAMGWYEKIAEQGSIVAQSMMATCTTRLNQREKAEYWSSQFTVEMQKRADAGDLVVATKLGEYYLFIDTGKTDVAKAYTLLSYAAENDEPYAQFMLGFMYSNGMGVVQDRDKAIFWFEKAAIQGMIIASETLADIYGVMGEEYAAQAKAHAAVYPSLEQIIMYAHRQFMLQLYHDLFESSFALEGKTRQ